jgi:hypothetical protein
MRRLPQWLLVPRVLSCTTAISNSSFTGVARDRLRRGGPANDAPALSWPSIRVMIRGISYSRSIRSQSISASVRRCRTVVPKHHGDLGPRAQPSGGWQSNRTRSCPRPDRQFVDLRPESLDQLASLVVQHAIVHASSSMYCPDCRVTGKGHLGFHPLQRRIRANSAFFVGSEWIGLTRMSTWPPAGISFSSRLTCEICCRSTALRYTAWLPPAPL